MSIVSNLMALIKRGLSGDNRGLSTGIPKLDSIIGGAQRNMYTVLFGATGSGKTSLVLYSYIYRLLKDNPTEEIKIVYYSLEVSAELLFAKLLSTYIYETFNIIISFDDILSKQNILSSENYNYIKLSEEWLQSIESKFIVFDKSLNAKILYSTLMPLLKQWGTMTDQNGREHYVPHNPGQYVFVIIDHLSLVRRSDGKTLKEEMDEVSSYLVGLRNKFYISPVVIMQQNRESSNMDRRKAELTEVTISDMKDTSTISQDAEIVLGIYSPFKDKLPVYRDYRILGNNALGDRFKSIIVLKNRYGLSDRAIGLNFFGEIGLFKELPLGKEITDYSKYTSLVVNNTLIEEKEKKKKDSEITFKF